MIAFAVTAFFLLAAAVLIVLWPLLRRSAPHVLAPEQSNLDIHRAQLAELDRDLESGTLGAERYEQAKNELERRVLPFSDGATLDVHISNLRKKIGGEHIRTVRGVGYMVQSGHTD